MGLFAPRGEVQIEKDGRWESYSITDGAKVDEVREMNERYWHFAKGTRIRFGYWNDGRFMVAWLDWL